MVGEAVVGVAGMGIAGMGTAVTGMVIPTIVVAITVTTIPTTGDPAWAFGSGSSRIHQFSLKGCSLRRLCPDHELLRCVHPRASILSDVP